MTDAVALAELAGAALDQARDAAAAAIAAADRVGAARQDIGRLEGKLDQVITLLAERKRDHDAFEQRVDDKHSKLAGRVSALEGNRHWVAGMWSAASAIGAAVLTVIGLAIKAALASN